MREEELEERLREIERRLETIAMVTALLDDNHKQLLAAVERLRIEHYLGATPPPIPQTDLTKPWP